MNTQHNLKIIIIFIFVVVYTIFFSVANIDKNNRIDTILNEHVENLSTHYNLIQSYFFVDALALKSVIQKDKKIQKLFREAKSASPKIRDNLRKELQEHLSALYTRVHKKDILHLQFVFSDNVSYLRMHKPDKYGDDLTNIRYSFKYANSQQKDIWGFEQGRTIHAFRYVFPFYDEEGNHLGAVEISLPFSFIQNKLIKISKLHSHFLVNRDVFNAKAWNAEDLLTKYIPSIEHQNYMYSVVNEIHAPEKKRFEEQLLKPFQERIAQNMTLKESFAIYHYINNSVRVISFLPIKNIEDKKIVAYLVSYINDNNIYEIYTHFIVLVIGIFFIFASLAYFIYVNLRAKNELEIYEKIISQTKSHMSFIDRDYIYQAVNNSYLLAHDRSKDEIIGHSVSELLGKEIFEELIKERLDICLNGKEVHYSNWFELEGCGPVYMEVSYYPYIVNGSVKGIVVSSNDITKLHLAQEKLKELANKDQLTNLYNRRYFYDIVENIIHLVKREKSSLSLLMIDIDKFKNVNDIYGHANGDKVIKSLASLLLEYTRESDIVARIGGEEFVVLLPNTSKDSAFKFANKLREFTQEQRVLTDDKQEIKFTISIGVGLVEVQEEKTIDKALNRADKALYKAKNSGRNKVC